MACVCKLVRKACDTVSNGRGMKQNRFILYTLLSGLLIGIALAFYVYSEYLGEDTDPSLSNGSNPIISQPVNGVITNVATNAVDHPQKLSITYTDLSTKKVVTFTVNTNNQSRFHVGDTITKDKGEKILLVYQKGGEMTIVPVD